MPNVIASYFRDYIGTVDGFRTFHNQVINMPRDVFGNMGLSKLQTLAFYLSLIRDCVDAKGNDYKEIMKLIASKIPDAENNDFRDLELERRYFVFDDLDEHYESVGRMFRHLMGLCAFWGMIKSNTRRLKSIQFDRCDDFVSLLPEQISSFTNNISLNINIKTNDFISNLAGIRLRDNADYRPTLGILKYISEIGRPVTDFEISILLGRIDNLQIESVILERALKVGRTFVAQDRNGQMIEFFRTMNWVNADGTLFTYVPSQQPWFKFRSYLLLLTDFGLLEKNDATNNYNLTEYAKGLLGDLPANVLDLNRLINRLNLESGNMSDTTMKDILIKTNMDTLSTLIAREDFIEKVNLFSLANPIIRKGKRCRNQFVAELAKIRERYTCQAGTVTFEGQGGRNYVEAHHIIEFSKGGPDILENLLALGPTPHTQIHRGSDKAIRDIYTELMNRGAIRLELFEIMIDKYKCLNDKHLEWLYIKGLISSNQKQRLHDKIFGV